MSAVHRLLLAADKIRLLQQVERATRASWVTDGDVRGVSDAVDAFTGRRPRWSRTRP